MSKNTTTASPAKKTSTAPASTPNQSAPVNPPAPVTAKQGSKENPFTREEYSALPKESRLICTFEGKRGAWWKAQDGPKFVADGEGIRGRTEGSTNEGAGMNTRRLNAARLKLTPGEFAGLLPVLVADGTPGTEAFTAARAARGNKAKIGLSIIQAIMDKVQIDLPESEAKTIERARNADEIQALLTECMGDVGTFAMKLAACPTIKEVIPAAKGGKLTIAQMADQGTASVPPGTLAAMRTFTAEALNEAFGVLSA